MVLMKTAIALHHTRAIFNIQLTHNGSSHCVDCHIRILENERCFITGDFPRQPDVFWQRRSSRM